MKRSLRSRAEYSKMMRCFIERKGMFVLIFLSCLVS